MSLDRLDTSAAMVRVSVVSGVTVNACAEKTTSPVWPLSRRCRSDSSFSLARSSRLGSTSPASMDRDMSRTTTRASDDRSAGTGIRSQVGPASARMANAHAAAAPDSSQRLPRCALSAAVRTNGCNASSTQVRQRPAVALPRARRQTSQMPTGNSSSQNGRTK